jgi:hypothetical protein
VEAIPEGGAFDSLESAWLETLPEVVVKGFQLFKNGKRSGFIRANFNTPGVAQKLSCEEQRQGALTKA